MKLLPLLIIATVASLSSFVVHVGTVEWLPTWIGNQMQGLQIQASWEVRYIAAITSIEYGIAALALYYFAREKLLCFGVAKASLIFSILLTSIHGAFIRQPLMDFMVGNPIEVVLLQNSFKWLVWFLMSFVVVFGFELIAEKLTLQKSSHA